MKPSDRARARRTRKASGKLMAADINAPIGRDKLPTLSTLEADLKPKLQEIVDAAIGISCSDFGSIQLLEKESSILRIVAQRGFPPWWLDFWNKGRKGQGSCGVSLERGKRVVVRNVEKSPIFAGKALEILLKAGVRAVQSTPIVSRSGEPLGIFSTHYSRHYRPDKRTLRLLDLLARQAADIIGEARYRAALRQSEERLRALLTAASNIVFRMSPDWTEMREFDAQGFLSDKKASTENWLEKYVHPDDQSLFLEAIQKSIRTKSALMLEHRVRRADGTLGWTFSRAVPILNVKGEITEWFGAASDLTEWKWVKAEAQAIMDLAPVAVFIARDPQCLEISGNRMAHAMLRIPEGSNLSKSAPDSHQTDHFRLLKDGIEISPREMPIQKAAATGQTIRDFDMELVFRDGTRRFVAGNAVPIPSGGGPPRGAIGTFLDVSALKEAEERFRVFVENAPVAVIIHDPHGKIAVVNSQAERLFGYSRNELVGQRVGILIPERMRRKHEQQRNAYMKDPRVRPMGIGLELTALRKDGHEFPVEISLSPIETTSGTFIASTVLDLTDRKRFEEQARLAAVLLERARFARDLHDTLAQGFAGIIMNLQRAQAAKAIEHLPEKTRTLFKVAENLARESLEDIRHSIEELSAPSNLRLTDLASSLRKLAGRAHPGGKPRVQFSLRGMPRRLDTIVEQNLFFIARQAIDNALLHARANVIRVGLTFGAKDLRIRVQDDGHGFEVKRADHGFGLANMRDRAKYIGGQFKLKSQSGKGTVVEVKFRFPATGL